MKKIKALVSLLLISLTLTGCNVNDGASVPVSAPDSEAENISLQENSTSSEESAPSVSSTPKNDNSSTVEYQTLTRSEWEQIISLFKEWSFLDSGIHPFMDSTTSPVEYDFPECVDRFNYITEEHTWNTRGGVVTETEYYYKVVSGACATEAGFHQKLDGIFTETMKKKYLESPMMKEYRFRDDGVYVGMLWPNSYISMDIPRSRNASITLTLSAGQLDDDEVQITVLYGESQTFKFNTVFKRTENGDFILNTIFGSDEYLIMLPVLFDHKSINVTAVENTRGYNVPIENPTQFNFSL